MSRYRLLLVLALLLPFAAGIRAQTVRCSSDDGEKHYCEADTRYGAHLLKQTSAAECVEGKTWGWDEEGIWVNKGCAGQFELGKAQPATEPAPEHPPMKDKPAEKKETRLSCASNDGRRNYCDADVKGATVRLARQAGPSPCMEDSTWGHDDKGIWVDRGCRGEFVILPQGSSAGDVSCDKAIGKKEAKKLLDQCLEVSPATHPPCNAANSCVLIQEEIKRSCALVGKDAPKFCDEYK